ncbi:MAG: cysteine peptidase family C39 domain-containing protein [Coleofasciculaceae cyanobacterium]
MSGNQGLLPNYQDSFARLGDILSILRLQNDSSLTNKFSQTFETRRFQLGDELTIYNTVANSSDSVHQQHNDCGFYIINQGRVRLLGVDTSDQREISAMVLETGESFGTETVFANIPGLSRAIAACDGEITWIDFAQLQPWLEQLPQLQAYLSSTANARAKLLFFKTATDLRRLSGRQLQELLPYLKEITILAGVSLSLSCQDGHFWLASGEINGLNLVTNWSDPTPTDWIAQTDVVVYQLPAEHQEIAITLGITQQAADHNGHKPQFKPPRATRNLAPTTPATPTNSTSPLDAAKADQPVFPEPARRRRIGRAWWQRYPFIQQQSSSDCGAACLAMIGQYWGKQFSLNTLRNLAGVGRSGASLKGITTAAESLGFQARPVRASLSRLSDQTNPWIAHWEGNHYIVVYQVKGDRVLVADPAVGKRQLSRAEFTTSWTGYALLLDPTTQFEANQSEKNSLGRFWQLLWPYRGIIGQIVLASLLLQVFGLVTPLFTQIILDKVVVNKSFVTLHVFALGLILFGIWRTGLTAIRQYLLDYFSNRLDLIFISGFINHTLRLPLKFFESRQVGDIITRVQEAQKIQVFLTKQAVSTWLDTLMVFVYIGLMSYYNWHLTLLVLALIPPLVILTVVASPFLRQVSREIFKEEAGQNSLLVEMIMGVATVKAAASEQEVRWRWEERLTAMLNMKFKGQAG